MGHHPRWGDNDFATPACTRSSADRQAGHRCDGRRGHGGDANAGSWSRRPGDPGEELPHVGTGCSESSTRPAAAGSAPSHPSAPPGGPPAYDGWVRHRLPQHADGQLGRQPAFEEYVQIMTSYTPGQMPVLSAIARIRHLRPLGSARCLPAPSPTGRSSTPRPRQGLW